MSQAPIPLETAHGYSPPTVTQFSVFLPNKVGKLHDLVEALDKAHCIICALAVYEASDHAVVRIIPGSSNLARSALNNQKLAFSERDVLVVALDQSRTLSSLCLSLLRAELSIHFAYPLMVSTQQDARIALAVDDLTLAGQILRRKEFRLLGEHDLSSPV